MKPMTVTLFGATGFVGRYIVRLLAAHGHQVNIAARRPKQTLHLKPAGEVGQIAVLHYRDTGDIPAMIDGSDAVISLAGILYESRAGDFERIHHELPGTIAKAAADAGVKRLVHISAIGADPESKSAYARSKAAGETAVMAAFEQATILRPSIIFGPEDNFFNQFAAMSRFAPFLPLIGGGSTRFQPVYVNDVAEATVRAVESGKFAGQTFELGGPDIVSFKQCLSFILEQTGRSRLLLPVPMPLARLKAMFLELLPQPLLTRDQLLLLETDNIVSPDAQGIDAFGIVPASIEAVVPRYLQGLGSGQQIAPV